MVVRYAGIDEAGLGPVLGPMGLVCVSVCCETREVLTAGFATTRVGDSKRLHKPGDLAPLERVALAGLAWLQDGRMPQHAAELFDLLGEGEADRAAIPWMAGAADLVLPVAATAIPTWRLPGLSRPMLAGCLIQPETFNEAQERGMNRCALELERVGHLLGRLPRDLELEVLVDRLGGRRYYADALRTIWQQDRLETIEETAEISRYRSFSPTTKTLVEFAVGGESRCPLVATASCIAKYARELHMTLFNRYWSGRHRWLAPTAGYPQDARRWLHQLGGGQVEAWSRQLVRQGAAG